MSGASEYLATVERFYLVLRRQGLTLSAHDIRLVETWEAAQIPINTVCKALLDGAEQFKAVNGGQRLPMTLHYFADQVERAAHALKSDAIESNPEPPEPIESNLSEELTELAWIGRSESCPRRRNAYRAAWRSLKTGNDNTRSEALMAADTVAVDCFWDSLNTQEQAQVIQSVEQMILPELPGLGTRGTRLRRRALLEDEICRQFDLVRLSDSLAKSGRVTRQD
ncbi:MAG TPA: hypothetical protein EYN66_24560 [Myxococcales bacterium]|nr:hypothetical protein [Myxococcales bacterium]